jgi:glycerophosphoryl diester phosphodiesterase
MNWPRLIAHRGASAYAPENTMEAFELLCSFAPRWIECDVTLTKDDIPIIFHDKTLKRQIGLDKKINELTFAQVQAITTIKIPSLNELLRFARMQGFCINLEIKPNDYHSKLLVKLVKEALISHRLLLKTRILISSFDTKCLVYAKNLMPQLPRALLLHKWRRNWRSLATRLATTSIHCHYKILTKPRIARIKSYDYKIYTYTVNNQKIAKKLFQQGVDGIFSDFPDLLSGGNYDV